jgi:hypothetical protein
LAENDPRTSRVELGLVVPIPTCAITLLLIMISAAMMLRFFIAIDSFVLDFKEA